MKFTAVAAISMAALVSAQSISGIPACALPCIQKGVASTSCSETDLKCICKDENFSKIQSAATSCVISGCGPEKALNEVLPATQKLCAGNADGGSSEAASSAAAPTEMATQMTEAHPTEMAEPSGSEAAGDNECHATMASQPCPATPSSPASNGTAPPAPSTPVTAGAAGLAPIGGLAMLAIGALAL
ncbi:CFEM domain protein [Metarhizium robertsii]|uniref:Extracellular membrane protein, CFEM domain protein n=2 Tax=Metarhizium robertsii TaxID=568076 RepID=E9EYB8_METRA|nr:Extracellular membrane protein, CFEM domain protein [Metarhizium robertsii ARSEF 23]EFZ00089.1 Extracellular membrane protein, CFEM domain protein [Metarhizium robertsii ARSEF 23]EXV06798.1 CFEM domain protein [Metarhizium robertsii]